MRNNFSKLKSLLVFSISSVASAQAADLPAKEDVRRLIDEFGAETRVWESPKDGSILFRGEEGATDAIFIKRKGGEPKRISTLDARADHPSWSPDGEFVIYQSELGGSFGIWTMRPDGSDNAMLFDSDAYDGNPMWTAAGEIIFMSEQSGKMQLWRMSAEGGEPKRLTNNKDAEYWHAVSKDGEWVAFSTARGATDGDLVLMNLNSGAQRILTTAPGWRSGGMPVFSPDGHWLYYTAADEEGRPEFWAQNLKRNASPVQITQIKAANGPYWPTISRDGAKLRFTYLADYRQIYAVDSATGDIRQVTDGKATANNAALSPDGSRLVYLTNETGNAADLALLDLTSGEKTILTNDENFENGAAWSPDGKKLSVARSTGGDPSTISLFIIDAVSGEVEMADNTGYLWATAWCAPDGPIIVSRFEEFATDTQLYAFDPVGESSLKAITKGSGRKRLSACSPDGAKVLYSQQLADGRAAFSVSLEDGAIERIDLGFENVDSAVWSPDGKMLAFVAASDDDVRNIYVKDLETEKVFQITDDPYLESGLSWSPDGKSIYYHMARGKYGVGEVEIPVFARRK